ncbi:MAG: decaprenyl-phosphate phosphoribosyltransferase [Chloroflexales bacterium]|nr:decaprenyl-phosphate phosphoribosyltransferase [Chloroflexales bacterium]
MREISTDHPMQGTPASGLAVLWHLLRAMRPRQWIKNIFIFPAIVFSEERLWTEPNRILTVCLAFVAFCMAASAIYLVNDLVDIEKDRAHPRKRNRPLASGKLSPSLAITTSTLLIVASLTLAYAIDLSFGFMAILVAYITVQGFLYTYFLKNIVILDILTLAAGFVLRAIAGAVVLHIPITPWLLVSMGLLAIFMGIGKRRHELVLLENGAGQHRRILNEYSVPMLDQMMSIVTASVIMAYSMATFSAPVAPKEPFPALMITIPFVVYGIFRYLYLIYQRDGGGSPEDLLLKDPPLALCVVFFGLTIMGVLLAFPT